MEYNISIRVIKLLDTAPIVRHSGDKQVTLTLSSLPDFSRHITMGRGAVRFWEIIIDPHTHKKAEF